MKKKNDTAFFGTTATVVCTICGQEVLEEDRCDEEMSQECYEKSLDEGLFDDPFEKLEGEDDY